MSAATSSTGGPLKKKPSAHRKYIPTCLRTVLLPFALAALIAPFTFAQSPRASGTELQEFAGTYKQLNSEKRLRVLEKDGHLVCESVEGAALIAVPLIRASSGDLFEIKETYNSRQQVTFFRDRSGKIAGVNFAGNSYLRLISDLASASSSETSPEAIRSPAPFPGPAPSRIALELSNRTGDFANQAESDVFILFERRGRLLLRDRAGIEHQVNPLQFVKKGEQTSFTYTSSDAGGAWVLAFEQHTGVPIWEIFTQVGPYHRLPYSVPSGSTNVVKVKPARPLSEIRKEALAAAPPEEKGSFRKSDLVELAPLDRSIRLDIRYATSNDFLGTPVYTQARAFLQRPAAEALVRAVRRLQPFGFGLLIHDGYRPWYITKIFWDATGPEGKIFVADPAQGSRHNRGCAVDLSLYDLKTDQPVEMTGLYDEMSPRSFPDYPGGTSLQRWRRDLLRWAMEAEGFTVYESEWWHFDYQDWHEYAILNIPFEKLDLAKH